MTNKRVNLFILLFLSLSVLSCQGIGTFNVTCNDGSSSETSCSISSDSSGGGSSGPTSSSSTWDFSTPAEYTVSDSTLAQVASNKASLIATDLVDDDNTVTGFSGGAHTGTTYSSSVLTLNTTTNNSAIAESWIPDYSSVIFAASLDGTVGAIGNGALIAPAVSAYGGTLLNGGDGSTSYVTAKLNQGITFDGADDSINFGDINELDGVSAFTISYWVNLDALTCNGTHFSKRLNNSNRISVRNSCGAQGGSNDLNFYVGQGANTAGYSTSDILSTGKWYHVVVRYDGTQGTNAGRARIFVDGNELTLTFVGTIPATTDTNASPFYLGYSGATYLFNGTLDEMIVWNKALDVSDIELIYDRQSPKYAGEFQSRVMNALASSTWTRLDWLSTLPFGKELPDGGGTANSETSTDYSTLVGSTDSTSDNDLMSGILGLWHLNETAAGSAPTAKDLEDKSGNSNHCTETGGGTLDYQITGKFRTGIKFDDTGFFECGDDPLDIGASVNFTASVWVKKDPGSSSKHVMGKMRSAEDKGWLISIRSDETAQVSLRAGTGSASTIIGTMAVADSTWHHILIKREGTVTSLYVDGKFDGSINYSSADLSTSALKEFEIGNGVGGNYDGSLDEVALWSRALTDTEVVQLYRRGANRLKLQVRACSNSDCSDQDALTGDGWLGPDGTNKTYFTEIFNNGTIASSLPTGTVQTDAPQMTFSDFDPAIDTTNNLTGEQYLQYRVIGESFDENTLCTGSTTCFPEINSVTLQGPATYPTAQTSVVNVVANAISYTSLSAFAATEVSGGSCAITYQLSPDGTTFYHYSGGSWVAVGSLNDSNSATDVNTQISDFSDSFPSGTLYFKAVFTSTGGLCEISDITVTGIL